METLIDKAAKVCGSDAELARRLGSGTKRHHVFEMRAGTRPITPRTAALLAEIAGEDSREAALAAIVENERNPEIAERLKRIFFMGRELGAAVTALFLGVVLLGSYEPSLAKPMEVVSSIEQNAHSGM